MELVLGLCGVSSGKSELVKDCEAISGIVELVLGIVKLVLGLWS